MYDSASMKSLCPTSRSHSNKYVHIRYLYSQLQYMSRIIRLHGKTGYIRFILNVVDIINYYIGMRILVI